MSSNADKFDAFVTAIETNDPAIAVKLCRPDVSIWHNTTLVDETVDAVWANIRYLHANFTKAHYERHTIRETTDSVIGEVVLSAVASDGDEVRTPTCMIIDFRDGDIVSVRAYLDSARSLATKAPR